jgi:hypothetical protein
MGKDAKGGERFPATTTGSGDVEDLVAEEGLEPPTRGL